ncbi:hypothetical protein V3851_10965 [Paenibacillus sp. M1]|uniref:Type IV pilus assembly protein PilO n=1 Tax=Paenibacillus haidiansis TaxID=1574488 RepID=A0ABU7VRE7_9BACL
MNLSPRPDKKFTGVLLAAVAIILLSGLFYLFWFRPAYTESKELRAENEEKLKFLQATESIVSSKRQEADSSPRDELTLNAAVPDTPEQDGILRDLEQAAKESGAQIIEVSFDTDEASEGMAVGKEAAMGSPAKKGAEGEALSLSLPDLLDPAALLSADLSKVPMKVRLKATIAQVKEFAASLQEAKRLYVVESFSYGEEAGGADDQAVVNLSAFLRLADNP